MMKTRTPEELSDSLSYDLAWRKKELALLLADARHIADIPEKQRASIRSAITLLYAHWEGFIRNGAVCYLEYVARRRLLYKDLQKSFCVLGIRSKIESATKSARFDSMMEVASFFLEGQNERSDLPTEKAINTRFNLNSKVLKEILMMLSLEYLAEYQKKEIMIDKQLLDYRNNIAHGRETCPPLEILDDLFSNIINLLDIYKNQIENAASNQTYRKKKPNSS